MRRRPGAVDGDRRALRRELLALVAAVAAVDAAFIGLYGLVGLGRATGTARVLYTVGWTVATLLVVLRGLGRIREARLRLRQRS